MLYDHSPRGARRPVMPTSRSTASAWTTPTAHSAQGTGALGGALLADDVALGRIPLALMADLMNPFGPGTERILEEERGL